MTRILGVNGNVHDSSVCLVEDGQVRFAVEEERLNRRKHFGGVPEEGVRAAAQALGGSLDGIDWVAIPWIPGRYLRYGLLSNLPRIPSRPALHLHEAVYAVDQYFRYRRLERQFLGETRRLARLEHHLAHAASAFLVSPFDEAAILTYDARGEDTSTALWHGRGTRIDLVRRIPMPHSLGHLYAQVTRYLGFGPDDEYKVMGLAGYGTPRFKDLFDRWCRILPDGTYRIDRAHMDYYRGFSAPLLALGPPRGEGEPVGAFHRDVAASLQAKFEETALSLAGTLRRLTGAANLCIAGGCGLNGVANGRILREAGYRDVYVQPAAGDSGIALGAAFHVWNTLLGNPRGFVMDRADFGPEYPDGAIESFLTRVRLPRRRIDDLPGEVAGRIASGQVIGWFQGRAELGPRALGFRSILADPRDPGMKDRVNRMVKNREEFRPFAPAVVEERASEFFETDRPLPFMVVVLPVRAEHRARLPAVTHVDGTARIQTVSRGANPRFHALLSAFGARTGVPVLLNTSFNLQGEPIVCTPADAVRTFYASGLDALVLGSYLIEKTG